MALPEPLFADERAEPIELVVPGPPPQKNRRYEIVSIIVKGSKKCPACGNFRRRGIMKNSDAFLEFVEALRREWLGLVAEPIKAGRWRLRLRAYWTNGKQLDVLVPKGDTDGPISAVLDALQLAGVIDDDARVMAIDARSGADPGRPRVEIRLEQLTAREIRDAERAALIAHVDALIKSTEDARESDEAISLPALLHALEECRRALKEGP